MSNVTLDRAHCVETIISLSGLRSFELDKESESRLLQAFNSPVPRGTYLADYLDGAAEAFESAIRSDIVMPFASSIRETRRELDESAKALAPPVPPPDGEEMLLSEVNEVTVALGHIRFKISHEQYESWINRMLRENSFNVRHVAKAMRKDLKA